MPLEAILQDNAWLLVSHWSMCPFAEKFKKPKSAPVENQKGLFQ
jgi:hypothetical protein